jgi:hypothetical protein
MAEDLFGRPSKNHTSDRVLVLKPMEGKNTLDSKGMTDNRLFTGENKLHARMDPEYGHWYIQYEKGNPPPALQMRWTSFQRLLNHLTDYYKRRNIQIVETVDT